MILKIIHYLSKYFINNQKIINLDKRQQTYNYI